MSKQNERTLTFKKEFLTLRKEGHSIGEIAEMFHLSKATAYRYLEEIAKEAGLTRQELLERPIIADHSGRNFTPVKPVDREKFVAHFDAAITEIAALKEGIEQVIDKLDSAPTLEKEEVK